MPTCLGKVVDISIRHNMCERSGLIMPMDCVHACVTEHLLLPSKRAKAEKQHIENLACSNVVRPLSKHYVHTVIANLNHSHKLEINSRHNRSLGNQGP